MDRVRKALDLARLERARAGAGARLSAEPGDTVPTRPSEESTTGRSLTEIVYSRTKVFSPVAQHLEGHRVIPPSAGGRVAAAYRMLRTQVLQRMDAHNWRTLGVFSARAEDGKTTTAINLAASMGSDHLHTVLLVDLDLRRPTLADYFGLSPQFGVDDVLLGRAPLEDCLYHPEGFERLVLLPARAGLDNSSEILSGPPGRALVAELHARYPERVIIFDLPPVLNADDALSFAPQVECGLVVAAEGRSRRTDLVRTIELLEKTPLVGTVLNRAADVPSGY
jgi:protein-tyrosine kinase